MATSKPTIERVFVVEPVGLPNALMVVGRSIYDMIVMQVFEVRKSIDNNNLAPYTVVTWDVVHPDQQRVSVNAMTPGTARQALERVVDQLVTRLAILRPGKTKEVG